MDKLNKIVIDVDLIAKYFSGEATPEEALAIEEWAAKTDNTNEFYRLKNVWQITGHSSFYEKPEINTQWDNFENSILEKNKNAKIFSLQWTYLATVVAASLIFFAIFLYKISDYGPLSKSDKKITLQSSMTLLKDTLPDGSMLVLNRNSSIQYSENFIHSRKLQLIGEAYFNVLANKKNPFVIKVGDVTIEVVGTSFNVNKMINPEDVEVQVNSGRVMMYTYKNKISLIKGQTGIYTKSDSTLSIKNSLDANSISYATGSLNFNNMSLKDICANLQKTYGVNITIKENTLLDCRMSASFQQQSLDYILNVISVTLNIKYTKTNNTIVIYGEGCN